MSKVEIKEHIEQKYDIDISKVNLFKLYKIDSEQIDKEQLESKFSETRKRWQMSINGANEKFAQRDAKHLEKADIYEEILSDEQLRKELFGYYNQKKEQVVNIDVADTYFKIKSSSRKIRRKDIEFFYKYYPQERKNKKAIHDMLKNKYKLKGLDEHDEYDEIDIDELVGDKKSKGKGFIIKNNFEEKTIIKINKCTMFLQQISEDEVLNDQFENLNKSLYEFFQMSDESNLEEVQEYIGKWRDEAFVLRQEKGQAYTVLVDLFNTAWEILGYKEVLDNWEEFKLIIKYYKLNPYMYGLKEVNKDSIEALFKVASDEYGFKNVKQFMCEYFLLVYANFSISVNAIMALIRSAKAESKKTQVVNKVYDILGFVGNEKLPLGANIIHFLVYWPFLMMYYLFEIVKTVFVNMSYVAVGAGALLCLASVIAPIISSGFDGIVPMLIDFVIGAIGGGLIFFMLLELESAMDINCDWIGYDRTYKKILKGMYNKTVRQYQENKNKIILKKLPHILINMVNYAVFAIITYIIANGL